MTNLACTRHGFPLVIIPSGKSAVDNITMGTNLLLYSNHQVIANHTITSIRTLRYTNTDLIKVYTSWTLYLPKQSIADSFLLPFYPYHHTTHPSPAPLTPSLLGLAL